jgi:hypothetical protein
VIAMHKQRKTLKPREKSGSGKQANRFGANTRPGASHRTVLCRRRPTTEVRI